MRLVTKVALASIVTIASIFLCGWYNRDEAFSYHPVTINVKKGDTIWALANDTFLKQDRYTNYEEWVFECRKHNKLIGSRFIYPGQQIEIPIYKRIPLREQFRR